MSDVTVNFCSRSQVSHVRRALGTGPVGSHILSHPRSSTTEANDPFRIAADMLDVFGVQQGGSQYRRLIASFQRVFGATIIFGTDLQREKAAVMHQARFNFMREARIWYSRDPKQTALPGGFENETVLSDEFFREVIAHSIPIDLGAAKALSSSPAALDLSCGSRIVALRRKPKSEFRYSVTLDSRIDWESSTMHVRANSESDWKNGST